VKHVLYFTAEWCKPCEKVKPIVEQLNRDQITARFFMIDADSETEMVEDFGIRSIPTFVLIEDNKEVGRINGAKTREELITFIEG
jgi:thioredoxin-like negative regulator of GroEL